MTEIELRPEALENGGVRLHVGGELDMYSSQALSLELTRLLQENPQYLEIELSQVTYMDSSGVAVVVKAWTAMRRLNRELRVIQAPMPVRSIFKALSLGRMLGESSTSGPSTLIPESSNPGG